MINTSSLYIVNDIDTTLQELIARLPKHSTRIIQNEDILKNEFQIEHAHRAIKEAYIAENTPKYIFLCAASFRIEAQNSLLKVLEEPPKNIIFILITLSKNSILPTILSRVQVHSLRTTKQHVLFELPLDKLTIQNVSTFLKKNQRISKTEAKDIVESMLYSIHIHKIPLCSEQLEAFSVSMKLLELNSKPITVLTTLILNIMGEK